MATKYIINGREVSETEFRGDANATAERFNDMVLSQRAPTSRSDREFLLGHCNGSQFERDQKLGDFYKRRSEFLGQSVTGKIYLRGLAAFPGDPRAWVSGRGDVQKVCEDRGWNCEGNINVKTTIDTEPPPPPRLAKDLVEKYTNREIALNPELKIKQREEVKEMVIEQYGRPT